jgi:hypothetical protein
MRKEGGSYEKEMDSSFIDEQYVDRDVDRMQYRPQFRAFDIGGYPRGHGPYTGCNRACFG